MTQQIARCSALLWRDLQTRRSVSCQVTLKVLTVDVAMPCSVLEDDKQNLQGQLAEIEEVKIAPLQANIAVLNQEVATRDAALAEHQSKIAELEAQCAVVKEQLELKRSKKQAYKQAFAGKVIATVH